MPATVGKGVAGMARSYKSLLALESLDLNKIWPGQ